jgi:hypothetical protein
MAGGARLRFLPGSMDVVAGLAFQTFTGMDTRLMLLDGVTMTGRALGFLELLRVRQVFCIAVAGNAFQFGMVRLLVFLMTIKAFLRHATERKEEE